MKFFWLVLLLASRGSKPLEVVIAASKSATVTLSKIGKLSVRLEIRRLGNEINAVALMTWAGMDTSSVEGTQTSITDLYALEAEQPFDSEHRREDAIEVRNYVRAFEHGLERRKTLPVSLRLLREMHAIHQDGARGAKRDPGEFRRSQVWIGGTGAKIEQASYVLPPPGQELETALAELERFIHGQLEPV
jgi:Fic family protein